MTREFCDCGMPIVLDRNTIGGGGEIRFHCAGDYCSYEEFVSREKAMERVGRETFLEVA